MGGFGCLCKSVKNGSKPNVEKTDKVLCCNCGWEIDSGYAVACGLAILEAKRIFLLALGVFVDWNVIYLAGGLVPIVLTIVAASIGVPAALATIFSINKRRRQPCFPSLKNLLKYISVAIILCCVVNVIATVSIPIYMNTSPGAMARVFNTSMMLYSDVTWHKVTIDRIQFSLQCCGHTEYSDWIAFDWQRIDYASRDEMASQRRVSDEIYRPMAVPYSCCNIRSMTPCFHVDLSMSSTSSINEHGCAKDLSNIVLRSAIVTYCVSIFLVLTQIVLAVLLIKIVKRPLPSVCPSICECTEKGPSVCPLLESSTSCCSTGTGGCTSGSDINTTSRISKKRSKSPGRLSTISSRSRCTSSSPSPPGSSSNSKKSSFRNNNSSARTRCSGGCGTGAAARIKPSLHTEHTIPKKRSRSQKRAAVRPN